MCTDLRPRAVFFGFFFQVNYLCGSCLRKWLKLSKVTEFTGNRNVAGEKGLEFEDVMRLQQGSGCVVVGKGVEMPSKPQETHCYQVSYRQVSVRGF